MVALGILTYLSGISIIYFDSCGIHAHDKNDYYDTSSNQIATTATLGNINLMVDSYFWFQVIHKSDVSNFGEEQSTVDNS